MLKKVSHLQFSALKYYQNAILRQFCDDKRQGGCSRQILESLRNENRFLMFHGFQYSCYIPVQ